MAKKRVSMARGWFYIEQQAQVRVVWKLIARLQHNTCAFALGCNTSEVVQIATIVKGRHNGCYTLGDLWRTAL